VGGSRTRRLNGKGCAARRPADSVCSARLVTPTLQPCTLYGPVAQRSEQGTHNSLVPGSNPGGPIKGGSDGWGVAPMSCLRKRLPAPRLARWSTPEAMTSVSRSRFAGPLVGVQSARTWELRPVDLMPAVKYNLLVGWRERDYARFTKQEWDAYTGHTPVDRSRSGRRSSARGQPVGTSLLAAVAISAAATALFGWGHITSFLNVHVRHLSSPASISSSRVPARPATSKVIGIRWRTEDLAPAAQAGRICVTDPNHGRICASYVVGERPADTLTRRIDSLGLSVQSNG
jgi:hypothetical protein